MSDAGDGADVIVALTAGDVVKAERVGPKAVNLAKLHDAGLPVPDGFCLTANAYWAQITSAGVEDAARRVAGGDGHEARRCALEVRLGLTRAPLTASLAERLGAAFERLTAEPGTLVAVRSSALLEDSPTASFAGQFETFLGIGSHADLVTAVRACWASLWSPQALRYMQARGLDPAKNAVAILIQPLVQAQVAGGALSRTPDDRLVLTAAWGLGPAVGRGEVIPDRYVVGREGPLLESVEPGEKDRQVICSGERGPHWQAVAPELVSSPCLDGPQALALARLILRAEAVMGSPVEVEWALDDDGFHLLQARPIAVTPRPGPNPPWNRDSGLKGQPAGTGWAVGPACVVRGEAELDRVEPGDILVTVIPGPALSAILPRVAGVVAESGGSTSHLAALARERGIPAVLGVRDATRQIRDGELVAVDGTAGVVYPVPDRPCSTP